MLFGHELEIVDKKFKKNLFDRNLSVECTDKDLYIKKSI
jgi:hypothetical protein